MDQPVWHALAALAGTAAAAGIMTRLVLIVLRRRLILDHPNERSSHKVPVPRGGGWGATPVVLIAWAAIGLSDPNGAFLWTVAPCAVALMAVSWWDDLSGGLSPVIRLAIQLAAVAAGLAALPPDAMVFQGWVPAWLDRSAAGFVWLWFVNLFNFMDGIDGISGTELGTLGVGLGAVTLVSGTAAGLAPYAMAIAGAGLGFLVWNWHPAKVFLGDVGSVPLGYLAGFLLISAAAAGLWLPALILPLYYLADATITLLRRLLRGEKIWRPHREHFYQQAVRNGFSHSAVVRRILVARLVLLLAALAASFAGAWSLVPAGLAVLVLLHRLATARPAVAPRLERV